MYKVLWYDVHCCYNHRNFPMLAARTHRSVGCSCAAEATHAHTKTLKLPKILVEFLTFQPEMHAWLDHSAVIVATGIRVESACMSSKQPPVPSHQPHRLSPMHISQEWWPLHSCGHPTAPQLQFGDPLSLYAQTLPFKGCIMPGTHPPVLHHTQPGPRLHVAHRV